METHTEATRFDRHALALILGAIIAATALAATLFAPSVTCFPCRAAQHEARQNLKALYIAEEAYRADHGTYAPAETVGFQPVNPRGQTTLRYDYVVDVASATAFRAHAEVVRDVPPSLLRQILSHLPGSCPVFDPQTLAGDTWTVDASGSVVNTTARCSGT